MSNRNCDIRPLVSIVVPVYNVAEYLSRCIDSIRFQSYKNIEIILVDDGSTDKSGCICEQYSRIDNRIKVIHQKNGGLSSARNTGIKVATGEYVAFIDADDFVSINFINRLLTLALVHGTEISICGFCKGRCSKFPNNSKEVSTQLYTSDEMLRKWHGINKHIETMAWNKLYLRELFVNQKMRYPQGYFYEDVQLTHLLVNAARHVVITNEKLYYYFQRKGSITTNWTEKKINDSIEGQSKRIDFFRERGYVEAYQRLMIKLQKYYMLIYCKVGDKAIKKEMYQQFVKKKAEVSGYKESTIWERTIFFIFEKIFR